MAFAVNQTRSYPQEFTVTSPSGDTHTAVFSGPEALDYAKAYAKALNSRFDEPTPAAE